MELKFRFDAEALRRHDIPDDVDTTAAAMKMGCALNAKWNRVFIGRFMEPVVTLRAIGKEIGVGPERVRQIECRIARLLRRKRFEITEARKPVAERSIAALGLPRRTTTALINEGVDTLGELAERSEGELLRVPNFGRKSLEECRDLLAQHGMAFAVGAPASGPEHGSTQADAGR